MKSKRIATLALAALAGTGPACGARSLAAQCDVPPATVKGSTKRVFVTTQIFPGDFGRNDAGVPAAVVADVACALEAADAGLSGDFRAWLSTSAGDALPRIESDGPWYGQTGTKENATLSRLFDSRAQLTHPMNCLGLFSNARGEVLTSGDVTVWTGTNPQGLRASDTCHDFTSRDLDATSAVGVVNDPRQWSDAPDTTFRTCPHGNRFLCFQL